MQRGGEIAGHPPQLELTLNEGRTPGSGLRVLLLLLMLGSAAALRFSILLLLDFPLLALLQLLRLLSVFLLHLLQLLLLAALHLLLPRLIRPLSF